MRPQLGPPVRTVHPTLPELIGGVDLSTTTLSEDDGAADLAKMMANAEYWLSFDIAQFEPLLSTCPSPIRELGVGVALRFGEDMVGYLAESDIERAQTTLLEGLSEKTQTGLQEGLEILRRAVVARDRIQEFEKDGFTSYEPKPQLSIHALRAMGKALIDISGATGDPKKPRVPVGMNIITSATDDRKRTLEPPEIENATKPPLMIRNRGKERDVVFLVPGLYTLRVPGRASGERKLLVG